MSETASEGILNVLSGVVKRPVSKLIPFTSPNVKSPAFASLVTECGTESLFLTFIIVPGATVIFTGLKELFGCW